MKDMGRKHRKGTSTWAWPLTSNRNSNIEILSTTWWVSSKLSRTQGSGALAHSAGYKLGVCCECEEHQSVYNVFVSGRTVGVPATNCQLGSA